MTKEKAKTLMCPWTFNQNPKHILDNSSYMCVADKCMAWVDTGYITVSENDKEVLGYCKLLGQEES